MQTTSGCTVSTGLATCPLTSQYLVSDDLPVCTTSIIVPLPHNVTTRITNVHIKAIASKPMPQLTEVLITAPNKKTFASFQLHIKMTGEFFKAVPNLQVFSLKAFSDVTFKDDTFKLLRHLHVLEFTRIRRLHLASFIRSIQSIQHNPIHSLVLKGVQHLSQNPSRPYVAILDLQKLACSLKKTLCYLDLSHNDFLAISSTGIGCMTHLKTLDLS